MAFNFKINPYTYDNPKVVLSDGLKVEENNVRRKEADTKGLEALKESGKEIGENIGKKLKGTEYTEKISSSSSLDSSATGESSSSNISDISSEDVASYAS